MFFQFPDGLADGGLGQIQMLCSCTHGAVFGDSGKNRKMANGHVKSPFLSDI